MRVVAISDVTLGYGTPQLSMVTYSLADYYQAEAHVVEPVQPELLARHGMFPGIRIHRVATAQHPHSELGRAEYVWRAAKLVNELNPDVLVICCTYCLPVLFRLRRRPRVVVYYSVESIAFYGPFDEKMNHYAGPLVDVVIFPEENRAVLEVGRYGFQESAKAILYNCVKRRNEPGGPLPAAQRNGKILYSGTISKRHTFAEYFLHENVRNIPMDLFGPIKAESEAERREIMALSGEVSYRGMLSATELAAIRKLYAYSIVMWNPINENQYYAAPNKFFESIADGVPPIAAPHPQCKLIIGRYNCGLLMRDWTFDQFEGTVRTAREMYGTADWQRLVDGCARAVVEELTWDAQFDKLKLQLPAHAHAAKA